MHLLELSPENGRALQELGHVYRDAKQPMRAIDTYARAINANAALIASCENRLALLREHRSQFGEHAVAVAEKQFADLRALPKPLLTVSDLIAQGHVFKAEELCRSFLQKQPKHTEGMRLLADIASRLGALEEAQFLLETACELEPDKTQLRVDLIRVLSKRQRFSESLSQAEVLRARAPDNLQFQSLAAIELLQLGRYDEALAAFNGILEKLPTDAATLTSRGHAQKTCGQTASAIESYLAACATQQASGEAWYALANLKTYRFNPEQIATMRERLEASLALMDRVYLSFALAKALEDSADYTESFTHYQRGNALRKTQLSYRREAFAGEVAAQVEHMNTAFFERLSAAGTHGCQAPDPIFILGMPRAGSTLLEQILASHSAIDGTRELPNILAMAQRLRRRAGADGRARGYPQVLHDISEQELAKLGEEYLEQAAVHRSGAPFFIDKMPNNFRHVALIHAILPKAKIIDARREARACCFSNYKQLFAEGQEFSYDLTDIGDYYRRYTELMAHWDRVLPGRVYRLQHEDLFDDFEGELERLFAYLELPLEPSCLRYYESSRPVRTPSSEQVRQPLFRDAQDQWQNYAQWLGPLLAALDP